MTATVAPAAERAPWRAVAVPTEHGGWGLTLEPVVLGLAVAWSVGGLAVGVAAFGAFLLRTPLKLALVDRRRGRRLERTALAWRVVAVESAVVVALGVLALVTSGPAWMVPVAIAAPLVAVELWFDVRSRSRRLVPELAGAVGMASVVAAIAVAGGADAVLAGGLWLVLAARSVGSIPFVRARIVQLHRGSAPTLPSDLAQVAAVAGAVVAVVLQRSLLPGAVAVFVIAVVQVIGVRRPPVPARGVGFRQMGLGLAVVAVTATGVLLA